MCESLTSTLGPHRDQMSHTCYDCGPESAPVEESFSDAVERVSGYRKFDCRRFPQMEDRWAHTDSHSCSYPSCKACPKALRVTDNLEMQHMTAQNMFNHI